MKLSDFTYHIPDNQIAQHPLKKRDASRLFVLLRKSGGFEHRQFTDIIDYLNPGDVLVLNDTRVVPVRLPCVKPGGGKAEITLLKEQRSNSWEALAKGIHEGTVMLEGGITARVSRIDGTLAQVDFEMPPEGSGNACSDIKDLLHDIGVMPLPLYIKRDARKADAEQYQTVYAKNNGAVAAPTAGLHFTGRLIDSLKEKAIQVRMLTLHVGYGTFKPVTGESITDHHMDGEYYHIPEATAGAVNAAKAEGRRVVAVGTTVTRSLETAAQGNSDCKVAAGPGSSSLFIYPGYRFNVVDALLTNFHLPRSTPMMLAAAFSDLDLLKKAYSTAVREGYRFFSYGDAMLMI